MKFSLSIVLASAATLTSAIPQAPAPGACPAVWTSISQELTAIFVDENGQCNGAARQAVRAVFHDCGTWNTAQGTTGGCDGSLFLSPEENARPENTGLQAIAATLMEIATRNGVSVADMIIFAGAHATVSCPLGPQVPTLIGRTDNPNAAPAGLLPSSADFDAEIILTMMADKGLTADDTVALVGAHTTARQFRAVPNRQGQALDSTPGIWDVAFYGEVSNPPADVVVFNSDRSLSQDPRTAATFQNFVGAGAQGFWNFRFRSAYEKLSTLGNVRENLVDCRSALPAEVSTFPGANPPLPAQANGAGNGSVAPATRRRALSAAHYQH